MTAQASDIVVFNNREYELAEFDGSGLFDPREHGFKPVGMTTACWRGFVCTYEIVDQRLVLKRLNMGSLGPGSEKMKLIKMFGQGCTISISGWFGATVEDGSRPVPFDGSMLIGRDFIGNRHVNMGFHSAYEYMNVWELVFHRGHLTSSKDLSKDMAQYRETHVELLPDPRDTESTMLWVVDRFSRRRRDKKG